MEHDSIDLLGEIKEGVLAYPRRSSSLYASASHDKTKTEVVNPLASRAGC